MPRPVTIFLVLLGLLGVLGAIGFYVGVDTGLPPLSIEVVTGTVSHERGDAVTPAEAGTTLEPGDRVRTGKEGQAVLSRAGMSPIQLGRATSLRLVSVAEDVVELELENGQVRARVRPDAGAVRLSSNGQGVLATDATFAMARDDATTAVEVERGDVSVSGVSGASQVQQGERLVMMPDGTGAISSIPDELLLQVAWPEPSRAEMVRVRGKTEPGALVVVHGASASDPVRADAEGNFVSSVLLASGNNRVVITVRDTFGRERTTEAELERDTTGPAFQIKLAPQ